MKGTLYEGIGKLLLFVILGIIFIAIMIVVAMKYFVG